MKQRMGREVGTLVVAVLSVLVMAGCGSGDAGSDRGGYTPMVKSSDSQTIDEDPVENPAAPAAEDPIEDPAAEEPTTNPCAFPGDLACPDTPLKVPPPDLSPW